MATLVAATHLACLGRGAIKAVAPVTGRPTLPPPSATPVPQTPPAGVQLHLTAEQKRDLVALLMAAQEAFAQGGYDVAEHTWLEAAKLDPSNVDARLGLGRVWLLRGVADDDVAFRLRAREAFAFVVQACPSHAQARRLMGLLTPSGAEVLVGAPAAAGR